MSQAAHLNTGGRLLSYLPMEALTVLASCVCRLGGAHLEGARLGRAYLGRADLKRADLRGAHLEQADLRTEPSLTQDQVNTACVDA